MLIHIFSYLNWTDSIHLRKTCVRMGEVNFSFYKKREFEFAIKGKVPLKKIFEDFGENINVISTKPSNINTDVMEKCILVKSLRIQNEVSRTLDNKSIKTWINKLKLESLWILNINTATNLFDDVTNLMELRSYDRKDVYKMLERNSNVKSISIELFDGSLNFDIFTKLQHLQCLHICVLNTSAITKVMKFGRFDGLTELLIDLYCNSEFGIFN